MKDVFINWPYLEEECRIDHNSGKLLLLFTLSTLLMSSRVKEAMDSTLVTPDYSMDPDQFPVIYKVIIFLNPMFLQEGITSTLGSGIFNQSYFQMLGPAWYWEHVITSIILYAVVSMGIIQYNIPRGIERNG